MAIYQFYLAIVPRAGLIKKYNQIPNRINTSTKTGYFESNTEEYWKLAEVSPEEFVQEIDRLVNRADWGNDKSNFNWKMHTADSDNDAWICINEGSGKIEELSFRADLREKDLKFLRGMINLSNKYNCLLMDKRGNLANPNFNEIGKLIETSNSYKFLQDPEKFLSDLDNRKIQPE